MNIMSAKQGMVLVVFFALILSLGSVVYTSQVVSEMKTFRIQYKELLGNHSQLQEMYKNQVVESQRRYTGNPFATELWPGQLQSENITGMHWYSLYNGALVNVTDNVLGLNGAVPLEGDYTSWTHKWTQDGLDLDDPDGWGGVFTENCFHILFTEDNPAGVGGTRKRHVVLSLEDGSITYASPLNGEGYIGDAYMYAGSYRNFELTYNTKGYDSFSIMGKYLTLEPYNETSGDWDILEVWKEGTKVWTAPSPSTIDPIAWMWHNNCIRWDGKYIIGLTWGTDHYFVCFEGVSP